jgi:chloramphenicol O-acetyltransferase type A
MSGYIDVGSWKQREHYDYFRGFANPFFSVCVDVDVTAAWRRSREPGGPSFFVATLHAAVRAADAVEPMRLRIRGDRIWLHDHVGVSTTALRQDETFGYARIPYAEDPLEFAPAARQVLDETRRVHGLPIPQGDDVIYHSTLPWLRFTAFSNALSMHDSIPRLVYGKCAPDADRIVMPVALEVHHAVVHGLDVARFYEQLQAQLDGQ